MEFSHKSDVSIKNVHFSLSLSKFLSSSFLRSLQNLLKSFKSMLKSSKNKVSLEKRNEEQP